MSTMRQIARLAGVSIATVSLALRDCPHISVHMRERIREIAHELNYVLPEARVPGFGSGRVIGYIIHDWFGAVATDMLRGAMEEARRFKFGITMMQVVHDPQWIEEAINNLLDLGISGLIIAHSYRGVLPARVLFALRSRNIHAVQIMKKVFAEPVDSVCRNERGYAETAAAHFDALGHRQILGLHMFQHDAWVQAFQAHDMSIAFEDVRLAEIPAAFQDFLRMDPRPTGIIAATDDDAFRLLGLARLHGLTVPGDLSILGLGRAYFYPEISVIDLSANRMGAAGIQLLAARIANGTPPHEITDYHDLVLPVELVDHGSTGPVNLSGEKGI